MCGKNSKVCLSLILVFIDAILLIGCPVLLVVFGVTLGKPYTATVDFTETSCSVIEWLPVGSIKCHCYTKPKCTSSYPCVEIRVKYLTESGTPNNATLFDDAHNFMNYGYFDVTDNPEAVKCSTYSCEGDPKVDAQNVARFVSKYDAMYKPFKCYYNKNNENEALLEKTSGTMLAIGIILPLVFFVFALLLLVYLYHRILTRRGEKIFCLGRFYGIQELPENELSPPAVPTVPTVSESTI